MRANVAAVLKQLDESASKLSEPELQDLLNILAALRGPDNDDEEELKWPTTAVIRHHVFRLTEPVEQWAVKFQDTLPATSIVASLPQTHFTVHIRWAIAALNAE